MTRSVMGIPVTDADLERFRSKLIFPEAGDCILWSGSTMWKGYGRFFIGGRNVRAHRFSYALSSELPADRPLDHLCHNRDAACLGGDTCPHRRCVNPEHLEPVTPLVNVRRSPNAPASLNAAKTHCPKGHPYSGENLFVRKNGIRECRECGRAETRRYLAARRAAKGTV